MLREFAEDSMLSKSLVLRGGTALNLEESSPPRLSVDLDFDYIGAIPRDDMLKQKPEVIAAIQQIGRSLGYQVTTIKDAPAGSTIKLNYQNSSGTQDLLRTDISWTNRVGIEPVRNVQLWQPTGVALVYFPLVGRIDLIAGKYRALIDRVAARDVFDAVGIARAFGSEWPSSDVQNAFVFLTGTLDLPLTSYQHDRIDLLTEEDFKNNLLPMLSPNQEVVFETLIKEAKAALEPMLNLSEAHNEFVERLHKGEFDPSILFPNETGERLKLHPHLLWKHRNVKEHLSKQK